MKNIQLVYIDLLCLSPKNLSPSTAHDQKSDTKDGQKQGSRGIVGVNASLPYLSAVMYN
jgi:hypothetical protein